jgi:hypothetical protein
MTDTRKCYTVKGIAQRTGISPQHIHRLTQNNTLNFEEGEFDKKEGSIVIYSDTALKKFMKYSKENHRGRKKKEVDITKS